MSKIEKHGLPTRATVGAKGDIYTDLDTGVKYECHGTYGFVDVDCIDEPVEYKWERVDMIDPNRLPEQLQFGEKTVMGDTITWDGNIEGLEVGNAKFGPNNFPVYRISEATPSIDTLLSGGCHVKMSDGEEWTCSGGQEITDAVDIFDNRLAMCDCFFICYEDNTQVTFVEDESAVIITLPKKGIYVWEDPDDDSYLSSITINGYNGFERTEIVTIDPKYIKDMYYEIPEVWNNIELVNDDWSGRATCKLGPTSIEWAENNSYRLRVDGEEYTFNGMKMYRATQGTSFKDVYYIGENYIPNNDNMSFTEYPVCLLTVDFENIYAVFYDLTPNHTVEILKTDAVIHPIPEKYLPMKTYCLDGTKTLDPTTCDTGRDISEDEFLKMTKEFLQGKANIIFLNTYTINQGGAIEFVKVTNVSITAANSDGTYVEVVFGGIDSSGNYARLTVIDSISTADYFNYMSANA